jgi:hypothetical protein
MQPFFGNVDIRNHYLWSAKLYERTHVNGERMRWASSRPCSAKCTEPGCHHKYYAGELNIPARVAYAQLAFEEVLPSWQAATWPRRFISAFSLASTTAYVWGNFVTAILEDEKDGLVHLARSQPQRSAIVQAAFEIRRCFAEHDGSYLVLTKAAQQASKTCLPALQDPCRSVDDALIRMGNESVHAADAFAMALERPPCALEGVRAAVQAHYYKALANLLSQQPKTSKTISDEWYHEICKQAKEARTQAYVRMSKLLLQECARPGFDCPDFLEKWRTFWRLRFI